MDAIAGIDFGSSSCRVAVFRDADVELFTHSFSEGLQPLQIETTTETKNGTGLLNLPVSFVSLKQKAGGEEVISVSGSLYSVANDITDIISQIRDELKVQLPYDIEGAVLAVPGFFPERPRSVLRHAALDAGFPGVKLFDEALAAVMGTPDLPESCTLLFYSLGAGTFSASLVRISAGKPRILSSDGNRSLGGLTFDAAITSLILDRLNIAPHRVVTGESLSKLRKSAESLKIHLSKQESVDFQMNVRDVLRDGEYTRLTLTRTDLENLIQKYLEDTVALARKALSESNSGAGTIDLILLSGGSTRIPLVEKLLTEEFSVPLRWADEFAIARGAARQGAQLEASNWKRQDPVRREEPAPESAPSPKPCAPTVRLQDPSPRTGEWVKMFAPYLDEAEGLWNGGQREKAISKFEEMMTEAKSYLGTLHHEIGKLHYQEGRSKQALEELEKALRVNSSDKHALQTYHEALRLRAVDLYKEGRLTEAKSQIQSALRLARRCPACLQVEAMIEKALKGASYGRFRQGR